MKYLDKQKDLLVDINKLYVKASCVNYWNWLWTSFLINKVLLPHTRGVCNFTLSTTCKTSCRLSIESKHRQAIMNWTRMRT